MSNLSLRRPARTRDEKSLPKHDIVVIGASAGGVAALQQVVASFPHEMQAAVFVVLHIGNGENRRSHLPEILSRAGALPAVHPSHGESIRHGRIYVAPPDRHLLLSPGKIQLSCGPKENRSRPAINALFRTAAMAYRGRVTGVILTGMLDDGVAGLAEVKRRGGIAIVQDPQTALFPDMPDHAIDAVDVDYITPLDKIGQLALNLTTVPAGEIEKDEPMERVFSGLTCPECRGPLTEERQGRIVEYRCRVGHVYSAASMAAEHRDTVERNLWATIVALEEAADISDRLKPELGPEAARDAGKNRRKAKVLTRMLGNQP